MNINNINSINNILDTKQSPVKTIKGENALSFGDLLKQSLNQVNELQLNSEDMKKKMILGEVENLHDVSVAGEKANIALQVTMSVRTKILEAYKDIIRLQI